MRVLQMMRKRVPGEESYELNLNRSQNERNGASVGDDATAAMSARSERTSITFQTNEGPRVRESPTSLQYHQNLQTLLARLPYASSPHSLRPR